MNAPNEIKFRFNPSSSKLKKILGPLEGDIMEVIWESGPTTVSAVHRELRERKDIAYTTVMTTMSRLAKKNILHQDKSTASYVYSPALSREEFERYVISDILHALVTDYGDIFVDCLLDEMKDLSPSTRDRLCRSVAVG